jgi:tetratricopeptide (TPR) repeat protein
MKNKYYLVVLVATVLFIFSLYAGYKLYRNTGDLVIAYPFDSTIFPRDMAPPAFAWNDGDQKSDSWLITLQGGDSLLVEKFAVSQKSWKPSREVWNSILNRGPGIEYTFRVQPKTIGFPPKASTTFSISADSVGASIFFRSVPLPFKFARENMKQIKWYLGDVSSDAKPHPVLENMPVCANCHSFSADGKSIAMDVDAVDDKGAYVTSSFDEQTKFAADSIMSWSKFQMGKFTYGLLSQISPDGNYVVSTLHDCEIFVDRKNLEYSQLFFPFKGILEYYDRREKRNFELHGANDTMYVHSNPCWTPDGKSILFTRAKARHFNESGIQNGSVAKKQDEARYRKFEKCYLDRDSLIKFDIYTIPFNQGKGGVAKPLEGASGNGFSNYFPRVSPDGKWVVFCQAESFMLLQKDSKLAIVSLKGGKARVLNCNSQNMNSWHSWSPNGKWLIFASKALGPYTQLFLTHINDDGTDTPPVYLDNFSFQKYANNIPEFVNTNYNKQLKIEPDFLTGNDFLVRKGEICQSEGDEIHAFEAFDEAVRKFPKSAEAYYKRGKILFQRNQLREALGDLNKALEYGSNPSYYLTRGIVKLKMGDQASALTDLTTAFKSDSTDYNANTYLGVAYTNMEKPQLAIPYLERAVRLFAGDYYSFYYLGLAYADNGLTNKAIGAFTAGIKICNSPPFFPKLHELRGNCYAKNRNYEAAINDFNAGIGYSANDPALYLAKGEALLECGRKQDAIHSLSQAKALGSQKASFLLSTLN